MDSTFRNKEIPEGKEVYIRSYLDCMYQEIQEKYKLDEPVESPTTHPDTMSLLHQMQSTYFENASTFITDLKATLIRCLDYIRNPAIDASCKIIYQPRVSTFPPQEDCCNSTEYKRRVFVKKALLEEEDPYSFTNWDAKPHLVVGAICIIGSKILSSKIQLCDMQFQYSDKPVFFSVIDTPIDLPPIRQAKQLIKSLISSLNSAHCDSLADCCAVLSNACHALADIRSCFGCENSGTKNAIYVDLNAEETKKGRYEVRYYVRNAKLFVEVVCLQKGESRGEIVVKDGKTYTVKEKITKEISVEFYDTVCGRIERNLHKARMLKQKCEVLTKF